MRSRAILTSDKEEMDTDARGGALEVFAVNHNHNHHHAQETGERLFERYDLPQLDAEAEGVAHDPRQGGHQDHPRNVVQHRVHGEPRQLVGPVELLEELGRQLEHVARHPEALPLAGLRSSLPACRACIPKK